RRAVDLDEPAETGPPGPRRLAAPQALPPGHGKGEAVLLGELLMREGRTEVGVETLRGWMTAVGLWVYRSRTRVSACSRVAVANWRLLGRPRWRDARAVAPSRRNARYRRRIWRSLSPSSAAARRRVSRRSASWDMTCSRSSSPIVSATVSAMAPLWPRGGHFYFGETGHLHFGPTGQRLIRCVMSTFGVVTHFRSFGDLEAPCGRLHGAWHGCCVRAKRTPVRIALF